MQEATDRSYDMVIRMLGELREDIQQLRVALVETRTDNDERIREMEQEFRTSIHELDKDLAILKTRIATYATIGAFVGGGIVQLLVHWLGK